MIRNEPVFSCIVGGLPTTVGELMQTPLKIDKINRIYRMVVWSVMVSEFSFIVGGLPTTMGELMQTPLRMGRGSGLVSLSVATDREETLKGREWQGCDP